MSEYQYYEFQAIDKPLTEQDMQALRELSTRAQITPTHFVNTYNWGDFRGDPNALMKKYFDAFLYLANWGTHRFMLRIPLKLLNTETVDRYCIGESAAAYVKGEYLILEFASETEDYEEEEEGEGWLSSLISLRSDLIRSDYRCLYLAWLLCAQMGELDDDEVEPPVPPSLGQLNASLKSFANFLRIDPDLIAVAAENSVSEDRGDEHQEELNSWISGLSDTVKNEFLLRLINGNDPHLGVELLQCFKQSLSAKNIPITRNKSRTVGELLQKAEVQAEERKRKQAEFKAAERARLEREKAIAREKYLADLAAREDEAWKKVETLIEVRQKSEYKEAVKLLVDLRDISREKETVTIFEERLQDICRQHSKKSSFMRLLKDAKLGGR